MITVLSDVKGIEKGLCELLKQKSIKYDYFDVNELDIKECAGCDGCTYKTYGKCIQTDNTDLVYPSIIHSDMVCIVTHIKYGNYGFKMKRVLDKFGLTGSRFYHVTEKKLKKGGEWSGARYLKQYYVIGVKKELTNKERDAFLYLGNEIYELTDLVGAVHAVEHEEEINTIMEGLL